MLKYSGNHQAFNEKLNSYLESRPTRAGLPVDTLVRAFSLYDGQKREWNELVRHGSALKAHLASHMPDVELELVERRSASVRQEAVGIVAYHTNAAPLDQDNSTGSLEPLFGAATDAFIFWRWGAWWLQIWDPVVVTGHVHRRVMSRSTAPITSFAEFHSALSLLWPALLALGNRRRAMDKRADVTFFCFPLWDGLAFADFQKLESSGPFAPSLWEVKNGEMKQNLLADRLSVGSERLLVQVRTIFGEKRFNARQKVLRTKLQEFVAKHASALEHLRRQQRFGLPMPGRFGVGLDRLFGKSGADQATVEHAISDLDILTKTEEWLAEVSRSQAAQPALNSAKV